MAIFAIFPMTGLPGQMSTWQRTTNLVFKTFDRVLMTLHAGEEAAGVFLTQLSVFLSTNTDMLLNNKTNKTNKDQTKVKTSSFKMRITFFLLHVYSVKKSKVKFEINKKKFEDTTTAEVSHRFPKELFLLYTGSTEKSSEVVLPY